MKKLVVTAVLLGASVLAGCGGGYYRSGVIVSAPPPAPIYGPVGYAPGPGYVWTDGFYDLRGGRWVLTRGNWVRPPHPHAVWVRPYWEHRGRGYRFHQGRWRR